MLAEAETSTDRMWREFFEEIEAQKAGQLRALLERRAHAAHNVVNLAAWRRLKQDAPT